jgi:tRNA (guanosine-2'-O-)-methyltransferase
VIPERYKRLKQVLEQRQPDLTVLTEDVHKPHNFSAIMRTCDAVGVFAMHAVNAQSQMPTYNQVSKGSEKWVYLNTHPDINSAIAHLKQANFHVYAAHFSEKAVDYRTIDYTKPTAILLGSERWGVSQQAANLADKHIVIPMLGMVKSLNVSVAAAIILFEAQNQRLKAGYYNRVRLDPEIYRKTIFEWSYPKIAAIYRQKEKFYPLLGNEGKIIE